MRIFLFIFFLLWSDSLVAQNRITELQRQFRSSPYRTGFLAMDLDTGQELLEYRSKEVFTPASVLKLLTSYTALRELHPEYVFTTQVFFDRNGGVPKLIVRGGGDPTFTIENLEVLARAIAAKVPVQSFQLSLDTSHFAERQKRSGQRAYEAGASAMSFNFNAVRIEVCPSTYGSPAALRTYPREFSVALQGSIKTQKGRGLTHSIDEIGPRAYTLRGAISPEVGCRNYYRSVDNPEEYFLTVLAERLKALGFTVAVTDTNARVSRAAKPLYTQPSKPLSEILEDLNHYSTNSIAEHLVAAIGSRNDGTFSHAVGLQKMREVARTLYPGEVAIFDGSGLSHKNKLTPRVLLSLLKRVWQDPKLNIEFLKSLSVLGRNGTLKTRGIKQQRFILRGKTGSLTGVSGLAGFISSERGKNIAFVMIQNGKGSRSDFQSKEMAAIKVLGLL